MKLKASTFYKEYMAGWKVLPPGQAYILCVYSSENFVIKFFCVFARSYACFHFHLTKNSNLFCALVLRKPGKQPCCSFSCMKKARVLRAFRTKTVSSRNYTRKKLNLMKFLQSSSFLYMKPLLIEINAK